MKRLTVLLLSIFFTGGAASVRAQVVPAANTRQVSITAGGMASLFQPDSEGNYDKTGYPVAQASSNGLFGVGAYVDVRLTRWVQLEAEGRWQRFNEFDGINQDNYLAGPRLPVYHFWKATTYAKALAGFSEMHLGVSNFGKAHGRYTDVAFGGGVDVKLTKRISWRAADVEYQYWPTWNNSSLSPYGVSMGIGYKIF
jgi:hypothetical protein